VGGHGDGVAARDAGVWGIERAALALGLVVGECGGVGGLGARSRVSRLDVVGRF